MDAPRVVRESEIIIILMTREREWKREGEREKKRGKMKNPSKNKAIFHGFLRTKPSPLSNLHWTDATDYKCYYNVYVSLSAEITLLRVEWLLPRQMCLYTLFAKFNVALLAHRMRSLLGWPCFYGCTAFVFKLISWYICIIAACAITNYSYHQKFDNHSEYKIKYVWERCIIEYHIPLSSFSRREYCKNCVINIPEKCSNIHEKCLKTRLDVDRFRLSYSVILFEISCTYERYAVVDLFVRVGNEGAKKDILKFMKKSWLTYMGYTITHTHTQR